MPFSILLGDAGDFCLARVRGSTRNVAVPLPLPGGEVIRCHHIFGGVRIKE